MFVAFARRPLALALLLSGLLLCAASTLRAQLPVDNLAWKDRCQMLASLRQPIQTGHVPLQLVSRVRSVPAPQLITFGFDRSRTRNHAVACTLFYMAAISARAASGGKSTRAVRDASLLGLDEAQLARGRKLSFSQRMTREAIKMHQVSAHALTSAQLQAVLDASDTMPISTAPAPKVP